MTSLVETNMDLIRERDLALAEAERWRNAYMSLSKSYTASMMFIGKIQRLSMDFQTAPRHELYVMLRELTRETNSAIRHARAADARYPQIDNWDELNCTTSELVSAQDPESSSHFRAVITGLPPKGTGDGALTYHIQTLLRDRGFGYVELVRREPE